MSFLNLTCCNNRVDPISEGSNVDINIGFINLIPARFLSSNQDPNLNVSWLKCKQWATGISLKRCLIIFLYLNCCLSQLCIISVVDSLCW